MHLPRVSGWRPRLTRNCIPFTKMALELGTGLPPEPRWRVGLNQSLISWGLRFPSGKWASVAHLGAVQWWWAPKKEQRTLGELRGTFMGLTIGSLSFLPNTQGHTPNSIIRSFIHSFNKYQISLALRCIVCPHDNFSETRMPCNIDIFDATTYSKAPETKVHSPTLAHHLCL